MRDAGLMLMLQTFSVGAMSASDSDGEIRVAYRFAPHDFEKRTEELSWSEAHTLMVQGSNTYLAPADTFGDFTEAAKGKPEVTLWVTETGSGEYTATFSLRGLSESLTHPPCYDPGG